jgi:hypothetical protein
MSQRQHQQMNGAGAITGVRDFDAILVTATAQTAFIGAKSVDWQARLAFHAESNYGPMAMLSFAAYAGFLQEINSSAEWGQGGGAYGKRFASTLAWSGILQHPGFSPRFRSASKPALLSIASQGFLAPVGACAARNDPHPHRLRRRDVLHLPYRQRVWRGLSFQSVVSGPPGYRPPGVYQWRSGTWVQPGLQFGSGVLTGSQEKVQ